MDRVQRTMAYQTIRIQDDRNWMLELGPIDEQLVIQTFPKC